MKEHPFVIGVDFGTDSVRALVVNAHTGEEVANSVFVYPRWKKGLYCNPSKQQYRQHPLDYLEGIEQSIKNALGQCQPHIVKNVKGISIDTTGSTPAPVNQDGIPLALTTGFEENPNAMFVLWKDHTSVEEAEQINQLAHSSHTDYTKYCGGIYSSEWFWAKILHISKKDPAVLENAVSWVEHCDWMSAVLTGNVNPNTIKRSRCAAGHKALWHESWQGLPPLDFLEQLHPPLKKYSNLFKETVLASEPIGVLSGEWALRLGLPDTVIIGSGAFDAHMGAVGAGIEPYTLIKVMGTSTCDLLVAPTADMDNKWVNGICGQVNGSIIPGMIGMEAGQSAFGDIYAWFKSVLEWPAKNLLRSSTIIDDITAEKLQEEMSEKLISELSSQAAMLPLNENAELALDWMNGRRTPDANQLLEGALTNLSLGSNAPGIFYALAEATCFGAKAIVDRFIEEGIPVNGLIGVGGVAKKSPFIMQMMADIMNIPIRIHKSEQTCALGAAMFAATSAGLYIKVEDAMKAMGSAFDVTYFPNKNKILFYKKRYEKYKTLGAFIEKQSHSQKKTPQLS